MIKETRPVQKGLRFYIGKNIVEIDRVSSALQQQTSETDRAHRLPLNFAAEELGFSIRVFKKFRQGTIHKLLITKLKILETQEPFRNNPVQRFLKVLSLNRAVPGINFFLFNQPVPNVFLLLA